MKTSQIRHTWGDIVNDACHLILCLIGLFILACYCISDPYEGVAMNNMICSLMVIATLLVQGLYSWESYADGLEARQPDATQGENTFQNDGCTDAINNKMGGKTMDIHLKSEEIDEIKARVGNRIFLESLRQSVVPPYLMLVPIYDLPDFIRFVEMRPLDEDGVHGAVIVLDVVATGQGQLTVGFKDMQTGKITHKKVLPCISMK